MEVTRLAPSPTGALHLGNARTFLVNWCLARKLGWRVVLRIEDLDGPRVKPDAERAVIEDLCWLGIDWDEGPTRQSERNHTYSVSVGKLLDAGAAYPCICTRKEVELAASAPHAEDGATVYPGTCRGRFASVEQARAITGRTPAIRFRVPDDDSSIIQWTDRFCGAQQFDARTLGDFVIAKADGTAAYQLAVVLDDAAAGVTQVVRGDDLLDSTPRQILLYRALGLGARLPTYCHIPLVVGTDGRRLAKRHGDSRIAYYRSLGVPAQRLIALVAQWSAMQAAGRTVSIANLVSGFRLDRLSIEPVIFTADDDARLRNAM